jgi:major intracellular serine protease
MTFESKVRLIPFQVEEIRQSADTVPPGVQRIEAPALWEGANYGEGVVVAILDTGADINHPDLKDRIIGGRNFTDEGGVDDIHDGNGHGSHVAGTIGATLGNGSGVVGVAPKVKLLICKVLTSEGSGDYDWIAAALNYVADWKGPNGEKVRVVNMSLGGPEDVPSLRAAIKKVVDKQIPVVVAAGNEGDQLEDSFEFAYPGNYNEVIEVAASTLDDKLAPFSNNNLEVDVIAPGVDILSTWPGSRYAKLSGTSMATPHVVGALALLIADEEPEFGRTLTEAEIYALLVKRTVSLGFRKSSEGHGLVKLAYMTKVRSLLNYIESNF